MLSEGALQSRVFQTHWNYYPHLRKRFCCISLNSPDAKKGNLNKALGVVKGTSDTFYLLEGGKVLWIEFKLPTGVQSDAQKEWELLCISLGHTYAIVKTEQEFWDLIELKKPN